MIFSLLPVRYLKFFLLLLIILTILIILAGIYLLNTKSSFPIELEREGGKIAYLYPGSINQARVEEKFKILENKKLSAEERYKALDNLSFFFQSLYGNTNDPKVRTYIKELGVYAQKEFPKLYVKAVFNPICQDPSCGQIISSDIKKVISSIESSKIDPQDKERLIKNLTNAGYAKNEDREYKSYVYNQVLADLNSIADISSSSSILEISKDLSSFIKKEYPEESK